MSKVRKEMKIEKEKKFKKEYLSVVFSTLILITFIVMMVFVVMYDESTDVAVDNTNVYENLEDLTIDEENTTCPKDTLNDLMAKADKVGATFYAKDDYIELTQEQLEEYGVNAEYLPDGKEVVYSIEIKLTGLEEGLKLKVSNNYNDNKLELTSKDFKNGEYTFKSEDLTKKIRYTIEVVSDGKNCNGETVRRTSFTTKVYNVYYQMMACTMYPKFEYCARMLDEEIQYNDFESALIVYEREHTAEKGKADENLIVAMESKEVEKEEQKEKAKEEKKTTNKILERIKEEKITIIVGLSIIGVGVCALIIFANVRRKRL